MWIHMQPMDEMVSKEFWNRFSEMLKARYVGFMVIITVKPPTSSPHFPLQLQTQWGLTFLGCLPSVVPGIIQWVPQKGGMVHQLLRDATNVDTGASKACMCAAQETQHQLEGLSCTTVTTQYIDETPTPLVQHTLLHTMPNTSTWHLQPQPP